jgi:hypothetical protein
MAELRANVPRWGANALFVYDDVLAFDRARLLALAAGIRALSGELGRPLRWICQLSPRTADADLMRALKESGCYSVCFGFESMSPAVLASMRKPTTPEQIARAFRLTKEAGLALQAAFIFGDPAESLDTAEETLGWWREHCRGQVHLGFVQPYPGSAIWRRCLERGLIRDELSFIREQMGIGHTGVTLNMTAMSDAEFRGLRRDVARAWSDEIRCVRPTALRREAGGRWEVDVRCPFCTADETYRNFAIPRPSMMTIWMNCRRCNMRFKLVGPVGLLAKKLLPPAPRFAVEALYNRSVILRKRAV